MKELLTRAVMGENCDAIKFLLAEIPYGRQGIFRKNIFEKLSFKVIENISGICSRAKKED